MSWAVVRSAAVWRMYNILKFKSEVVGDVADNG